MKDYFYPMSFEDIKKEAKIVATNDTLYDEMQQRYNETNDIQRFYQMGNWWKIWMYAQLERHPLQSNLIPDELA